MIVRFVTERFELWAERERASLGAHRALDEDDYRVYRVLSYWSPYRTRTLLGVG